MKNKILLFIKTPPPYHGASIISKYVKDSFLLKQLFNVRIIDSHYSLNVLDIGKLRFRKLILVLKNIFYLFFTLLLFKPKIVYFQLSHDSAFIRDFIYITLIKLFKVRIVFHLQGKGIKQLSQNNSIRYLAYKFSFMNEYIICLSNKLVEDVKNVYDGDPFIVPNCSPDFGFEIKNKLDENSLKSPIKIVYIANLIKTKGIFDLINASKIIKEKGYNFIIDIIGDEMDVKYSTLIEITKELGLSDNYIFHGPLYGRKKYEQLLKEDIFVFPTYYQNEAFPLTIIEAMQAGLPVISTYEGGIEDLVDDGITGFLVEKNNPEQLADKIEILIIKPELRKEMGEKGRKKYLENYTLEKFEQNIINVFLNVIKK